MGKSYMYGNYLPIQIRRYIKLALIPGIAYLCFKGMLFLCFPDTVLRTVLDRLEILFILLYILCFLWFILCRKYLDGFRKSLIRKGFLLNLLVVIGLIIL